MVIPSSRHETYRVDFGTNRSNTYIAGRGLTVPMFRVRTTKTEETIETETTIRRNSIHTSFYRVALNNNRRMPTGSEYRYDDMQSRQ